MRRVRPGELPCGNHGTALPPVHHYDRRVGDHFDGRGADAQPRDVFAFPQTRKRGEEKPVFPPHQSRTGDGQQVLRPDDSGGAEALAAHAGRLRHRAGRHLADEPSGAPELHAAGGSGLFHRGAGAARRGDYRAYARGDRPGRRVSDERSRRGVRAQRDGFESPRGHQSGAQPADRDPQTVGRPRFGRPERGDAARARRDVALSRKPGLPVASGRDSRSGQFGRFRDGARSARQYDLRRAAARRRYADALCRAAARIHGALVVDAGRYSAALFRRGPRQGAAAGRLDVGHFLHDEGLYGVDLRQ